MVNNKKELSYDTNILNLGQPKVPTTLLNSHYIGESKPLTLMMTAEELSELGPETLPMQFEKAGPREKLFFDPSKTKCAIVTCGGLCPGLNDVIRSIVIKGHYHYGIRSIIGIRNGLRGFIPQYGLSTIDLTPETVSSIYQLGGTMLGTSRGEQDPVEIVDSLERLNVNILFVIGGDGTMRAAKKIVDEVQVRGSKIAIIGIPKTIDNDINFITRSFGFDTAVEKAAEAIQCAHVEAAGIPNGIGLVKLMGRGAGFIAAQATLAMQEVNFLLVPEQPFRLEGEDGLLRALEKRLAHRGHALIVCAEGAGQDLLQKDKAGGEYQTGYGNPELGDICGLLIRSIKQYSKEKQLEISMKYIDPSYIIRSVPANAGDRVYCGFLGQHAVHAAMAGKTGMVVTQLKTSMVHLPLDLVVAKQRNLNIESDYWQAVMETTGQQAYFQ